METRIPYRPKSLFLMGAALCFTCMFCASGYMALHSNTEAPLFNLMSFNSQQSTLLYMAFSGICLISMIVSFTALYLTMSQKREIIFTENELQFPHKGFKRDYIHIPYNEIVQTGEVQVNSTNIFNVDHQNGAISLYSSMVPGRTDYEKFKSEITHRVNRY